MKPVVLIILDGVGVNPREEGNAVLAARTPNLDHYRSNHPHSILEASGEAVGLPAGFQGSSEVGHLSMGAGRIVEQELKRINDQIEQGRIYATETWQKTMEHWKSKQSSLHLFGLLQDEGVHAHYAHLFAFIRQARQEYPEGQIELHLFMDGRDTPPRSAHEHLEKLRTAIAGMENIRIATLMGRYYGMDRGKNWDLTDQAMDSILHARGRSMTSAEEAISRSYENDRVPTGEPMFDEYIFPHVDTDYPGVKPGDALLHTNYRQDRATQLTMAFTDPEYPGSIELPGDLFYAGMTRYYDSFDQFLLSDDEGDTEDQPPCVGEVISAAGLRQMRLAETQKFPHVTSFFNGKLTTPFPGEDRIEVPSRFDPSSFADHPEMEAYFVTGKFQQVIQQNEHHFVMVNYANGDMVGHTGIFQAGVKAVEVVDECLGKIVPEILERDGSIIITSDHGNVDQMIDYDTENPRTSHSLNPVECIFISNEAGRELQDGVLSDIGPTILGLLGLDVPAEMDRHNLIERATSS